MLLRLRVDAAVEADDRDSGGRRVGGDERRDHRVVWRVGVVLEQVEAPHAERVHPRDGGLRLDGVGGHQAREGAGAPVVGIEDARVAGQVRRACVGKRQRPLRQPQLLHPHPIHLPCI